MLQGRLQQCSRLLGALDGATCREAVAPSRWAAPMQLRGLSLAGDKPASGEADSGAPSTSGGPLQGTLWRKWVEGKLHEKLEGEPACLPACRMGTYLQQRAP